MLIEVTGWWGRGRGTGKEEPAELRPDGVPHKVKEDTVENQAGVTAWRVSHMIKALKMGLKVTGSY